MSQPRPYQPVLLRLLHGVTGVLVSLALITGFLVYNTYDKRWGSLPFGDLDEIQDVHGTIALVFLLLLPIFAIYSFHLGSQRLLQARSLQHFSETGTPNWWISMHRLATTLMLVSVTSAAITGRAMKEDWLPAGDLQRPAYIAHLIAWLGVLLSLGLHLLMSAKVGGVPLLLSMMSWTVRSQDQPQSWLRGLKFEFTDRLLTAIEVLVIGGIVLAFALPAFG